MIQSHPQTDSDRPEPDVRPQTRRPRPGCDTRRVRRRLGCLERAGLFDTGAASVRVVRATGLEQLQQAYELVHRVFVEQGYIRPQPGGMRLRPYEAMPETATFVALVDQQVVGVMSVVPDSLDLGLPSDNTFAPEIAELRRDGRRIAEVTNLAVDGAFRSTNVFMELSRCVIAHVRNERFDDLFISISPGHVMFFETVLGCLPCGSPRVCNRETGDTVEGKRMEMTRLSGHLRQVDSAYEGRSLHEWFFDGNPYYQPNRESDPLARDRFRDAHLLSQLFVHRSNLLWRLQGQPAVLNALVRRWKQHFPIVYKCAKLLNEDRTQAKVPQERVPPKRSARPRAA